MQNDEWNARIKLLFALAIIILIIPHAVRTLNGNKTFIGKEAYFDIKTATEIINGLSGEIEHILSENLGGFGSMQETFTDPDHFIEFSKKVLGVTKFLLDWDKLSQIIESFLNVRYPDLIDSQKQALRYTLTRIIALQYVTGLSKIPESGQNHPFSHHGEDYLSLSMAGKTIGRFDPSEQVFGSTPSDTESAIKDIKVKLSIMDSHGEKKPQILFVSNPVKKSDWEK